MKNCEKFSETQTASHLKEIIQPAFPQPNPQQTISYYVFGRKIFLWKYTEVYRHLFSKCFKNAVLDVKNYALQMFFLKPNRNMLAGKFVKSERLLAVLQENIISNIKWVEVCKTSEVSWAKLYCKMSDLLASFCWLWDFLVENLKLNSDDVQRGRWNVWTHKKNNILQKWILNVRFFSDCFRAF